jgi:hypothetical protein
MNSLLFYVVDVLLVAVVVAIFAKSRTARRSPLPPGPPAEPFIGHARLLPKKGEAEFFHEMRKTYGKVDVLSTPTIFFFTTYIQAM